MKSSTSRGLDGALRLRQGGASVALICVGLLVGLVPFLSWKGVWASHFILKAAAVAPLSLGLALGVAAQRRGRAVRSPDLLDLVALAFLGIATASTLASAAPLASLAGAYNHGIGLAVFGAATLLFVSGRRTPAMTPLVIVQVLAVAGSLLAVLVLLQSVDFAPVMRALGAPSTGRPQATLGNPNHAGAYLAAAAPAALGLLLGRSSLYGRAAAGLAFVLTLAALVVTFSRGAWLAGGVACLLVIVLLVARHRVRVGRRMMAAVSFLVVLAVVAGAWASGAAAVLGRLFSSDLASQGSLAYRFGLYEVALRGALDRPLLGWGPGGFGRIWQLYVTDGMLAIQPEDWAIDAHSLPLELLATMGIGGFLSFAALGVLSLRRALGGVAASEPASVAALAACVALGIALAFNPQHVLLTPLLFLLLGVCAGPPSRASGPEHAPARLAPWMRYVAVAALAVAFVASCAIGARLVSADRHYLQANVTRDGYRAAAAARGLAFYSEPYFQAARSLLADNKDADAAVGLYFEGLDVDTSSAYGRQSLAAALLDTGEYEAALEQAVEARALFPRDRQSLLVEAAALVSLDRPAEAQEAVRAVLDLPTVVASTYYKAVLILAPAVDEAVLRSILEEGLAAFPDDPGLARLAQGLQM